MTVCKNCKRVKKKKRSEEREKRSTSLGCDAKVKKRGATRVTVSFSLSKLLCVDHTLSF